MLNKTRLSGRHAVIGHAQTSHFVHVLFANQVFSLPMRSEEQKNSKEKDSAL